MSFAFVPRQLAQTLSKHQVKTFSPLLKGKEKATVPPLATPIINDTGSSQPNSITLQHRSCAHPKSRALPGSSCSEAAVRPDPKCGDAERERCTDQDLVSLVWLALSDHALWFDPELRRRMDEGDEGFIHLTILLRHSPVISHLHLEKREIAVARALRANPIGVKLFDLRLALGPKESGKSIGSYEIRRREWNQCSAAMSGYSRHYWEDASVYVENVPSRYQGLSSLAILIAFLTPAAPATSSAPGSSEPGSSASLPDLTKVQKVSFHTHHLDKPGDIPKPKRFALVVLGSPTHAKNLMEAWPWERTSGPKESQDYSGEGAGEVALAVKNGFRILSKSRWERLSEQYVEYRERIIKNMDLEADQSLLIRAAHVTEPDHQPLAIPSQGRAQSPGSGALHHPPFAQKIHANSSYPHDCLVFVKHIHDQTNKTTLRSLFTKALTKLGEQNAGKAIDYVDFTKGTDSCYLRLCAPSQSSSLVDFFSSNHIIQDNGLDDAGTTSDSVGLGQAIKMEFIRGRKEEIYWEKIPEKVRREAVKRAIHAQESGGSDNRVHSPQGGGKKRRKI